MRRDYFSNDYRRMITARIQFMIPLEFAIVASPRYMQHVAVPRCGGT